MSPASNAPIGRPGGRAIGRLGILGGSFDPVHVGHLHVARAAQAAFDLDHVVFVPAARPPHKPGQRLTSGEHRAAMLRLALAGHPEWSVDTLELERDGPSYTIDTVRALPARLGLAPGVELYLVLGEDNLRGLEGWREARALFELVQPIVVRRDPADPAALARLGTELGPEAAARIERGILSVEPLEASSTAIRATLAAGRDAGELLPPGVREYARRHALYASGSPP